MTELRKRIRIAIVFFLSISALCLSQESSPLRERTLTAQRIKQKIIIDGILNEPAWDRPGDTGFVQQSPSPGEKASEKTEVWIGYDDKALYVAARMYDSEPDKIGKQLGRRDDSTSSDWFIFGVDPRLDRLSGFLFQVNPGGSISDSALSNDTSANLSWDGVWYSAAAVDDQGWCVEMRIPYSQLRFPNKKKHTWGVYFERNIQRKNEKDTFVYIPRDENALVSRFALLEGIHDIVPPRHIEITPFVVGQGEFKPAQSGNPFDTGNDYSSTIGFDFKAGLSTNLTLDVTVNPDFGQVEVDPAVINLSAYETFFPEKRPFFIEGSNIFQFGTGVASLFSSAVREQFEFFYSRRIGRAPQGYPSIMGYTDIPGRTNILAAAKLSGKTSSNWNIGVLNALTSREYARIAVGDERFSQEVEPLSYYGVFRGFKEFGHGKGGLGIMATTVLRDIRDPELAHALNKSALALVADGWTYLDSAKTWVLNGWAGGTRVEGSRENILRLQQQPQHYFQRPDAEHVVLDPGATSLSGWTAQCGLDKVKGNWIFGIGMQAVSPGLEANDLGFQYEGDMVSGRLQAGYQWYKPGRLFLNWGIKASLLKKNDFGGNKLSEHYILHLNGTLKNHWTISGLYTYSAKSWDKVLTRGGPLALSLPETQLSLIARSDFKRSYLLMITGNYINSDDGGRQRGLTVLFTWNPNPKINLNLSGSYNWRRAAAQWVTRVNDPLQIETCGVRYVFGGIEQKTPYVSLRVNYIFNPRLSLQAFLQPFIAVGKYSSFKELARSRSFDFNVFGENGSTISYRSGFYMVDPDGAAGPASSFMFYNPDFNYKSLRGTMVLRWEYAAGSAVYLVWTQDRSDFAHPGDFQFGRDFGALFRAKGDNIFLIKFSYKWNL